MIRAVLFDAVGTLIHLREPVGETYARFAGQYGVAAAAVSLEAAFAYALRGMPPMAWAGRDPDEIRIRERDWWRTVVRTAFDAVGVLGQFADFDCCFDRLFAHYATGDAWRCADGAAELLRRLRSRGPRTGLVSNFDLRLRPLLCALGLAPLLDVVVLPADAGAAKPDRRIFDHALRLLSVEPHAAAYVGDDARDDVAGARNAGLQAIDVTTLRDLREVESAVSAIRVPPP